jgi:phage baseplate assembly protein W
MIVKQIKTKFTDLDLNFTRHPAPKDVSKISDARSIGRAIRYLVFTKKYESPFHPEIYCQVYDMLFEPMSPEVTVSIQKSIEYCISNFEPRVRITTLQVAPNEQQNAFGVYMEFEIINRTEPITIRFMLQRIR